MRLPFRRKAITGTPAVLDALASRQWNALPQLGGSNLNAMMGAIREAFSVAQTANYAWMYTNSPAVRAVVDLIARNIAQLDLRLFEEVDESQREERRDHPAAVSLRQPSDEQTPEQFVRAMVADYLCFNNAYALKFRNQGSERVILKPIPAQMVQVLGSSLFDPEAYKVTKLNGEWLVIEDPTDMLHWRGWNPIDPRIGLSPLETLRNVIAEDAALQQAIIELSKSGFAGRTYVKRPLDAPEWSNKAREGFDEWLANKAARATRTPFTLEEGMELGTFGINPQDAQMLEVRKWALQQVATQYGVPLGMVGLGEARAAQPDLAQGEFYSDTLPPLCQSFTRQLGLSVLQQEYGLTDYRFEFNLDEKHMGDNRLAALTSATGRPVLLTNEARSMVNRPPVDGGDELVTPLNVVVGEKPSPAVMPIQDPNKPAQDGSARQEVPPPKTPEPAKAIVPAAKAEDYTPVAQLNPRWKREIERQYGYVDLSKVVIERHFDRLERSLQQKSAVDWPRWDREFAQDIHRVAQQIVELEGPVYAFKLGGEFDPKYVVNWVRAMSESAAEAINQTIRGEITDLGLDGALARRAQHVESAGAGMGVGVTSFARKAAAQQSPHVDRRVKVWIPDTKRHAEFGGDTVPLGEDWPAGFAPGTVPNCKCSMSIE